MTDIIQFFSGLFDSSGFPARWVCGKWSGFHGWVYVISDLLIWLSYFSIPIILFYSISKRTDIPFRKPIVYFIAFILLCGITHLLDAIIFWYPFYRLNGFFLALTAFVSCVTAYQLYKEIPKVLEFKSPKELEAIIQQQTNSLEESNRKLRASEQRFKSLVENNPDLIVSLDNTYKLQFINQSAQKYTGETQQSWVGKSIDSFGYAAQDVEDYKKAIQEAITNNETFYYEHNSWIKQDKDRSFATTIVPLPSTEKDTVGEVLSITKDITFRKNVEKALQEDMNSLKKLTDSLKQKNQGLEDFSYIVSHNLRSPIGNIEALLTLFETESDENQKAVIADAMKKSVIQLKETVENLTSVVEIQQNGNSLPKPTIEFERLLLKNISFISSTIAERKASVTYDFKACPTINYPEVYLESILLNLLTNAIKYSSHKRLPTVHFRSWIENDKIMLSCQDNGIGIDLEKHKNQIFKLNKTFHNHPDARGVGLFITKRQIETLGGEIKVESTLHEGTLFSINLGESQNTQQENVVCVIDDDKAYKLIVLKKLAHKNIKKNPLVFSNGRSAISFITDNLENVDQLPDVLLLDLNMPIMNGWEFIDEYRKVKDQLAKQIKIYIVTMTDVEDKRLTQLKEEGVITGTIVKSELYQGNSILDAITG